MSITATHLRNTHAYTCTHTTTYIKANMPFNFMANSESRINTGMNVEHMYKVLNDIS